VLRRGEFPLAFAKLWADSGVEQRVLIDIGTRIEEVLLGRGGNDSKADRLGRLTVRVARLLGAHTYDEKSPQRQFVKMLFSWADARRIPPGDARNAYLLVPGFIVGAAELAVATSMACGTPYEAALAQLEADPDWLANMAFALVQGQKLPVSITDIRDTIRFGMTVHGRLRDWLLPEAIEKQRSAAGAKLARFLGVADLRGMGVSEVSSRIRKRAFQQLGA